MAASPNPEHPETKQPSTAARFRGTRAAHRVESAEDYVEAIAELIANEGEARVRDLAKMMGVSHVTVSRTIARLATQGLVIASKHRPITLTITGTRLARRVQQRHKTVLSFLLSLGVPRAQAELDAEGIEHHVSESTIRAMQRRLDSKTE